MLATVYFTMALSWDALIAFMKLNLTPQDASDRIRSSEHRAVEEEIIEKMKELESSSKSGLYTIGAVKTFVTNNVPALATAPAVEGIVAGDAVGFVGQTNKVENGAYIYTGSGYRRATTADGFNPVVQGGILTSGTAAYVIRNRGTILPGTTPQQWDSFYLNSGREEVRDEFVPIVVNGQKDFVISDDQLKTGEVLRRVWIDDPDKTKVVRFWLFNETDRKLILDTNYALRCRQGSDLFLEVAAYGTAGASYGLIFSSDGQKLYWRYSNEPEAKKREIPGAQLTVVPAIITVSTQQQFVQAQLSTVTQLIAYKGVGLYLRVPGLPTEELLSFLP